MITWPNFISSFLCRFFYPYNRGKDICVGLERSPGTCRGDTRLNWNWELRVRGYFCSRILQDIWESHRRLGARWDQVSERETHGHVPFSTSVSKFCRVGIRSVAATSQIHWRSSSESAWISSQYLIWAYRDACKIPKFCRLAGFHGFVVFGGGRAI